MRFLKRVDLFLEYFRDIFNTLYCILCIYFFSCIFCPLFQKWLDFRFCIVELFDNLYFICLLIRPSVFKCIDRIEQFIVCYRRLGKNRREIWHQSDEIPNFFLFFIKDLIYLCLLSKDFIPLDSGDFICPIHVLVLFKRFILFAHLPLDFFKDFQLRLHF